MPFLLILILALAASGCSPGLTQQQGDEIIQELKAIKTGLAQLEPRQNAPARQDARPTEASFIVPDGRPALGDANAEFTLVSFSDFQCPYCKRFVEQTLTDLRTQYIDTGKLRYVALDLPLRMHPQAQPAARAAHCAGEQNQYWDMYYRLYSGQASLGQALYVAAANDLGLDVPGFEDCMQSPRFANQVAHDVRLARSVGLSGTPSFVVGRTVKNGVFNGRILRGAQRLAAFENLLDELNGDEP